MYLMNPLARRQELKHYFINVISPGFKITMGSGVGRPSHTAGQAELNSACPALVAGNRPPQDFPARPAVAGSRASCYFLVTKSKYITTSAKHS